MMIIKSESKRQILFFIFTTLALVFLSSTINAIPECEEGDEIIEQSCDVFGDVGSLSWSTIDFQRPRARWDNCRCDGTLIGVRCFTGEGFLARRYNSWECLEEGATCELNATIPVPGDE